MATENSIPAGHPLVDRMLESVQYKHLVQAFVQATGLELHAYSLEAVPLTIPFDPPQFCRTEQAGLDCPLYFDPRYNLATAPEIRVTCGGLGHVVIPVMGPDGNQVVNLVSDSARFGPIDMEAMIDRAFHLRISPDVLAEQAEAVPLVSHERSLFAARVLFAGLHALAGGDPTQAGALEDLIRHVAVAPTELIPRAILDAIVDYTGADFAYINMLDDHFVEVAEASTLRTREQWWHVLNGISQWVVHAQQPIELRDVSQSAWCRHLGGSSLPQSAVYGVPLTRDGVFGAVVVGSDDVDKLDRLRDSLALFVDACGDALHICRRLVEHGDGAMVDRSGAYNLRFLEELLDREISRAGRHKHELSVVLFHLVNYPDLIANLGTHGAEEVLGQLVDLLRSKTRRVNSFARVSDSAFALVIPEADQTVADRIADDLRTVAQASAFGTEQTGKSPIRINLRTRTVTNPTAVDSALDNISSLN
ncbi:MAG TPA: diguanylate cyclase [Candidatus Dormibacteraeota bacterium]|nr:diguanylate cyclase [Candidatus Dormibacteraeota bacterium]